MKLTGLKNKVSRILVANNISKSVSKPSRIAGMKDRTIGFHFDRFAFETQLLVWHGGFFSARQTDAQIKESYDKMFEVLLKNDMGEFIERHERGIKLRGFEV